MSETETERNEAIQYLESKRKSTKTWNNAYKGSTFESFVKPEYDKEIKNLDTAISALRNQSEAERKIERVREYCWNKLELDSFNYVDEALDEVFRKILEILEGKENDR